jgi:Family of unknown function (DUF6499)
MKENWRLATAYDYLNDPGSIAFAWEFLRRNSAYQAAYQSVVNAMASVTEQFGCAIDPQLRADRAQVTIENLQTVG